MSTLSTLLCMSETPYVRVEKQNPVDIADVDTTIATADGHQLAGKFFMPEGDGQPQHSVVLHPATGVDYFLYLKLARYLAQQRWGVLIYDFRGTGRSAARDAHKDDSIRMSDWILHDVPAAMRHLKNQFPEATHSAVGHSVGAHGMLATQCEEPADAMVMIASHAGVTATVQTRAERAKIWTVFNVLTPLTAKLFGFVPVERIGLGKSIPVGVMRQWSRWTRKPQYFFEDAEFDLADRYAKATGPLLSVVFTDDLWANRRAVDILTNHAMAADVEKLDVEAGPNTKQGPVGHMGFYRSRNENLWPDIAQWLQAKVSERKD